MEQEGPLALRLPTRSGEAKQTQLAAALGCSQQSWLPALGSCWTWCAGAVRGRSWTINTSVDERCTALADLMNLIISVANYGVVPKSLGIPCHTYRDMSCRLVLPPLEEEEMGDFFTFHTPSS